MDVQTIIRNFTDSLEQALLSQKLAYFTYHRSDQLTAEHLEISTELKGKEKSIILAFKYHLDTHQLEYTIAQQTGNIPADDLIKLESCLADSNTQLKALFS